METPTRSRLGFLNFLLMFSIHVADIQPFLMCPTLPQTINFHKTKSVSSMSSSKQNRIPVSVEKVSDSWKISKSFLPKYASSPKILLSSTTQENTELESMRTARNSDCSNIINTNNKIKMENNCKSIQTDNELLIEESLVQKPIVMYNNVSSVILQAVRISVSKSLSNHMNGYLIHHREIKEKAKSEDIFHEALIENNDESLDELQAMIQKIYLYHLTLTSADRNNEANFILSFENSINMNDKFPFMKACDDSIFYFENSYIIDRLAFIQHLHEYAFRHRGTVQGRISIEILALLSKERNSYQFQSSEDKVYKQSRNVVELMKEVVPVDVVQEVHDYINIIKKNGWLSTNPDSVDGLPSLHFNLITNGKPLFDATSKSNGTVNIEGKDETSFEETIQQITTLLKPHLYDKLLTKVQTICNSSTIDISDVFIRNYGSSVQKLHENRFTLSPHYDIYSSQTCVIALDTTSTNGNNGLYAIHDDAGSSSSHAGLKQFIPLSIGDGVLHSYDILHGVDVDPNLLENDGSRTSLIIWFVDRNAEEKNVATPPWLLNLHANDDVAQFISALATECNIKANEENNNYDSYIKSAKNANSFALNHIAELINDNLLSEDQLQDVMNNIIIPMKGKRSSNLFLENFNYCAENNKIVARILWYESSLNGGNRIAQVSLADSLMEEHFNSSNEESGDKDDMLLLASTLFTVSAIQGYDVANDSVLCLLQMEFDKRKKQNDSNGDRKHYFNDDNFLSLPFVKTALLALE